MSRETETAAYLESLPPEQRKIVESAIQWATRAGEEARQGMTLEEQNRLKMAGVMEQYKHEQRHRRG